MPATCESLRARHEAIVEQYHSHLDIVRDVQSQACNDLVPQVLAELGIERDDDGPAAKLARAFVNDERKSITTFRFCRRARFSVAPSLKLLYSTLLWRFGPGSPLARLTPDALSPLYTTNALFFFHPDLRDKFGRPCAVINLRHVQRTDDGQLDALKDVIRLGWEVGRKWLTDLSENATSEKDVKLQIVVIVDLDGAGMSNLEVELLPFFMELLKNHFPGMIGAIFVLNYGWMYAGMWQLAKRVLPNTALERILFPTKADLLEFFDEEHLLVEHGGKVEYTYSPENPILKKYGQPASVHVQAYPSPSPSPSASSTSLSSMASNSSSANLHRHPSKLSMTSLKSASSATSPGTAFSTPPVSPPQPPEEAGGLGLKDSSGKGFFSWGRRVVRRSDGPSAPVTGAAPSTTSGSTTTLRRVASLAELQERLAETQKAIDSDDSELGDEIAREEMMSAVEGDMTPEPDRYEVEDDDDDEEEYNDSISGRTASASRVTSAATSARSSRYSSRVPSRTVSRQHSREGSPWRRSGGADGAAETFSSRAVKFSTSHSLSPYNHSNPYWGYPAFVPTSDPSRIPRPHYHRRRKRDLVRTLTYLAVLRFLALHRGIRMRVRYIIRRFLRLLGLVDTVEGGPGGSGSGASKGATISSILSSATTPRTVADDAQTMSGASSTNHHRVHFDSTSAVHPDGTRRSSFVSSPKRSALSLSSAPGALSSSAIARPAASASSSSSSSSSSSDKLERLVWLFVLFAVLRTPDRTDKLLRFVRFVVWTVPKRVAGVVVHGAGRRNRVSSAVTTSRRLERQPIVDEVTGQLIADSGSVEQGLIRRVAGRVGRKLVAWAESDLPS